MSNYKLHPITLKIIINYINYKLQIAITPSLALTSHIVTSSISHIYQDILQRRYSLLFRKFYLYRFNRIGFVCLFANINHRLCNFIFFSFCSHYFCLFTEFYFFLNVIFPPFFYEVLYRSIFYSRSGSNSLLKKEHSLCISCFKF